MATSNHSLKVVKGPLNPRTTQKTQLRTIHDQDGKAIQIRVIDVDSPDFSAQLLRSFRNSVRKARQENRLITKQSKK